MTYRQKLQSQTSDLSSALADGVSSDPSDILMYADRVKGTIYDMQAVNKGLDDDISNPPNEETGKDQLT